MQCCVPGCRVRQCDPAHVRRGTDGGTGLKPSDCWVVPLCHAHHMEQHMMGEQSFEGRYGLSMRDEAMATWAMSPASRPGEDAREPLV
jgi:hypothetical protein